MDTFKQLTYLSCLLLLLYTVRAEDRKGTLCDYNYHPADFQQAQINPIEKDENSTTSSNATSKTSSLSLPMIKGVHLSTVNYEDQNSWDNVDNCVCTLTDKTDPSLGQKMFLYIKLKLLVEDDVPEEECPPRVDVKGETSTFHYCPLDNADQERTSAFALQSGEMLKVYVRNREKRQIRSIIHLEATHLNLLDISCKSEDEDSPLANDCPCHNWGVSDGGAGEEPGDDDAEVVDVKFRLMVGLLSALFFLLLVGAILGIWWLIKRKERAKKLAEKPSLGRIPGETAAQNPGFDAPDHMYAEIGPKQPTVHHLPFLPDPHLRLGLQTTLESGYKGSVDSGLYSEPLDVPPIAGMGALAGPTVMRMSNTSLTKDLSMENHNPVVMNPMSPAEIDALYTKPNKVKRLPGMQPKQPPSPAGPTPPPMLNRSQDTPPAFRPVTRDSPMFDDRSASQDGLHHFAPPLATGSRSNSASNVYNKAPLSLPPRHHDLSVGEIYMTDNTHSASVNSLNASRITIETDV